MTEPTPNSFVRFFDAVMTARRALGRVHPETIETFAIKEGLCKRVNGDLRYPEAVAAAIDRARCPADEVAAHLRPEKLQTFQTSRRGKQ